MEERRVVITGMGTVNPVGNNIDDFLTNLHAGKSGISEFIPRKGFGDKVSVRIAGQVKDFKPKEFITSKEAKKLDIFSQYALVAALQAMGQADVLEDGILNSRYNGNRGAAYVATGIGGFDTIVKQLEFFIDRVTGKISPFTVPQLMPNAASHAVSKRGLHGGAISFNSACSSGTDGIGFLYRAIKHGYLDFGIAGGVEAALQEFTIKGFERAGALSTYNWGDPTKNSRPYDKKRDGFVTSEGAGIIFLEDLEHVISSGREDKIIAEVDGYSSTSDGGQVTAPDPFGRYSQSVIYNVLLEAAGVPLDKSIDDLNDNELERVRTILKSIDYINGHGTATHYNDFIEPLAIKELYRTLGIDISNNDNGPALSSIKGALGHLLGGAGATEVIAIADSIKNNRIPGTLNLENVDPLLLLNFHQAYSLQGSEFIDGLKTTCNVDDTDINPARLTDPQALFFNYLARPSLEKDVNSALSLTLGFGGANSALLLKEYKR